jgi:hypothetical protein
MVSHFGTHLQQCQMPPQMRKEERVQLVPLPLAAPLRQKHERLIVPALEVERVRQRVLKPRVVFLRLRIKGGETE